MAEQNILSTNVFSCIARFLLDVRLLIFSIFFLCRHCSGFAFLDGNDLLSSDFHPCEILDGAEDLSECLFFMNCLNEAWNLLFLNRKFPHHLEVATWLSCVATDVALSINQIVPGSIVSLSYFSLGLHSFFEDYENSYQFGSMSLEMSKVFIFSFFDTSQYMEEDRVLYM